MKKAFIIAAFLFIACSGKSEKNEQVREVKFSTPSDVVMSFVKALNAQDSTAIENVLSNKSKQSILPKIREVGGFKTMFETMKGMQMDVMIIGVDSASNPAKNIYQSKDSQGYHDLYEIRFPTFFRGQRGWRLEAYQFECASEFDESISNRELLLICLHVSKALF